MWPQSHLECGDLSPLSSFGNDRPNRRGDKSQLNKALTSQRAPKFLDSLNQAVIQRAPRATISKRVVRLSRFFQTLTAKKDAEVFR